MKHEPAAYPEDAAKQAEDRVVSTGIGMREWLAALPMGSGRTAVAAFDTRVSKPPVLDSAARGADKRLRGLGFRRIIRPESFWISESSGLLVER